MYAENDILFPSSAIPALRGVRGERFRALIDELVLLPATHERVLGFMLMMIRLNGCLPCETDSYRAMRGCAACAVQTLRRHKGSDDDLIALYENALNEVRQYATTHPHAVITSMDHAFAK
jgi:hypothetical protein